MLRLGVVDHPKTLVRAGKKAERMRNVNLLAKGLPRTLTPTLGIVDVELEDGAAGWARCSSLPQPFPPAYAEWGTSSLA